MTMSTNTLRGIGTGLGLHPNTLAIVISRARDRGEAVPEPVGYQGAHQGVAVFDVQTVEEWYAARSVDPVPRGPDKAKRTRTK